MTSGSTKLSWTMKNVNCSNAMRNYGSKTNGYWKLSWTNLNGCYLNASWNYGCWTSENLKPTNYYSNGWTTNGCCSNGSMIPNCCWNYDCWNCDWTTRQTSPTINQFSAILLPPYRNCSMKNATMSYENCCYGCWNCGSMIPNCWTKNASWNYDYCLSGTKNYGSNSGSMTNGNYCYGSMSYGWTKLNFGWKNCGCSTPNYWMTNASWNYGSTKNVTTNYATTKSNLKNCCGWTMTGWMNYGSMTKRNLTTTNGCCSNGKNCCDSNCYAMTILSCSNLSGCCLNGWTNFVNCSNEKNLWSYCWNYDWTNYDYLLPLRPMNCCCYETMIPNFGCWNYGSKKRNLTSLNENSNCENLMNCRYPMLNQDYYNT